MLPLVPGLFLSDQSVRVMESPLWDPLWEHISLWSYFAILTTMERGAAVSQRQRGTARTSYNQKTKLPVPHRHNGSQSPGPPPLEQHSELDLYSVPDHLH